MDIFDRTVCWFVLPLADKDRSYCPVYRATRTWISLGITTYQAMFFYTYTYTLGNESWYNLMSNVIPNQNSRWASVVFLTFFQIYTACDVDRFSKSYKKRLVLILSELCGITLTGLLCCCWRLNRLTYAEGNKCRQVNFNTGTRTSYFSACGAICALAICSFSQVLSPRISLPFTAQHTVVRRFCSVSSS